MFYVLFVCISHFNHSLNCRKVKNKNKGGYKGENKSRHNPTHSEIAVVNILVCIFQNLSTCVCFQTHKHSVYGCVGAEYSNLESRTACFSVLTAVEIVMATPNRESIFWEVLGRNRAERDLRCPMDLGGGGSSGKVALISLKCVPLFAPRQTTRTIHLFCIQTFYTECRLNADSTMHEFGGQ